MLALPRMRTQHDEGFTLIELLIVIVILGILSGIALFALGTFKSDAQTACSTANSRIDATISAAKDVNPSGTYTTTNRGSC